MFSLVVNTQFQWITGLGPPSFVARKINRSRWKKVAIEWRCWPFFCPAVNCIVENDWLNVADGDHHLQVWSWGLARACRGKPKCNETQQRHGSAAVNAIKTDYSSVRYRNFRRHLQPEITGNPLSRLSVAHLPIITSRTFQVPVHSKIYLTEFHKSQRPFRGSENPRSINLKDK